MITEEPQIAEIPFGGMVLVFLLVMDAGEKFKESGTDGED
jgi:hypothetical protein